jgi:phage terminase large subunit-like protein
MGLRGRNARPKPRDGAGPKSRQRRPAWARPGLSRVERVVNFLEGLPITKGHLAGKRMRLLPSQREFIESVYGHGGVRLAVLSEPRGNGKTGLLAGLTLAHLAGPEAIDRGETYSAAIDRNQAAILFREMAAIVERVPALAERINVVKHFKRLEVLSGPGEGSTYEALSNDARRGHGLAPSFWCFDELGQVKDRELLDALTTAMGKQPGALGIVISTQAPGDDHPLSQLIDDGLAGLDASVHVQLHAAPDDADPFAEETWRAVNPALGVFLDLADFRAQAARARRVPAFLSAFRNLRLNQRVHADPRLISRDDWRACEGTFDREALAGRACWAGLDLSSTTALTALVLVFEAANPGEPMPVLAFHWLPAGRIVERADEDKVGYLEWRDQGHIETPGGNAIDKHAIALRLAEIAKLYDLKALAFDEWRFADLEKILTDEGIALPLRKFRQGFKSMAPAVDELERAVVDRLIVHDGNPVLRMCIANSVAVMDAAGGRKIDKARSRARVDSAVCLAMALGIRATEPKPREYDFSRPLVLSA